MGQKVNPHGLRVGVIRDWDSRWFASDEKVAELLHEDFRIRQYLKKTLYSAGVPKIEVDNHLGQDLLRTQGPAWSSAAEDRTSRTPSDSK